MSNIHIKKGHDLNFAGKPKKVFGKLANPEILTVSPLDFPGLKPKILVKEGDEVKIGTPLFSDKLNSDLIFCSPGGGKVIKIQIGERRRIEYILIQLSSNEESEPLSTYNDNEIKNLKTDDIIQQLLKTGLWYLIRQRPFSKIANPSLKPKSIFIAANPTAPFSPDYEFVMEDDLSGFQQGLDILGKLTDGDVNLVISKDTTLKALSMAGGVNIHQFSGPHPAGNVGIHIHNIDPIRSADDIVWYINPQDVKAIGKLFTNGEYPKHKYVTVGGSGVKDNHYLKIRRGMHISEILAHNTVDDDVRIISGDVLSGKKTTQSNSMGYYDDVLTIIPEGRKRHFLGWMVPGFSQYSLAGSFPSKLIGLKNYQADTLMNGSKRAIIPFGQIESVLPMDILPTFLIKAILARDFEEMDKLGIYECSPEDFGLCTYADVSKMEISQIIQDGLDFMEAEG